MGMMWLIRRRMRRRDMKISNDPVEALLEPLLCIVLLQPVPEPNARLLLLSPRHLFPRTAHDNVEVHPEDSHTQIISRAEVSKVARLQEFLNSYSLALSSRPRIFSALGPQMVTCTAIFSLRLILNEWTV
ncbi:hypothetical protein FIBSPDRAFT_877693 [Athelia psychrophila]|uniref:Uncharacterized protein n=1 Tax=Athelia psychrophila TaxID=1759441 RepID=A0A167VSJ1_9AGAM|nr:hypothetical protein FIBSPDRAFT_877693 [Fibularhizoctonia sp. CBS 109695]